MKADLNTLPIILESQSTHCKAENYPTVPTIQRDKRERRRDSAQPFLPEPRNDMLDVAGGAEESQYIKSQLVGHFETSNADKIKQVCAVSSLVGKILCLGWKQLVKALTGAPARSD
jgi:hypothetical protein